MDNKNSVTYVSICPINGRTVELSTPLINVDGDDTDKAHRAIQESYADSISSYNCHETHTHLLSIITLLGIFNIILLVEDTGPVFVAGISGTDTDDWYKVCAGLDWISILRAKFAGRSIMVQGEGLIDRTISPIKMGYEADIFEFNSVKYFVVASK